jgi:cyclohexadieny/prephenate dehydrogenase
MSRIFDKTAIIGQGLIGSSISRAIHAHRLEGDVVITDAVPKVRKRLRELGIGGTKVVDTNREAVEGADFIIACVPVGTMGAVAAEIGPHLKSGAILSDVGSVKGAVIREVVPHLSDQVRFIPAHPLAGTEHSGPDSGMADLFENRWCILTPPSGADPAAVEKVRLFWQALGSVIEIMSVENHDYVLAITSHLPHLIAFTIFHTALRHEQTTNSEVIKFSASGFRDFTRIASSNPTMWRDVFLNNKEAVLSVLKDFNADIAALADAIEHDDAERLFDELSKSRLVRRKVIEKEHISLTPKKQKDEIAIVPPYGWTD